MFTTSPFVRLVLCVFALSACDQRPELPPIDTHSSPLTPSATGAALQPPSVSQPASDADRPVPYSEGKWKHIPVNELEQVVLWVSHVLIRHSDVEDSLASFNVADWRIPQPRSSRSRRDALALAERVAATARERGHIDELARDFSEDLGTRASGGSLGGVSAGQLMAWSEVLDALVTLEVGEVSRPVETMYGYHVFYRRPVPPEVSVTGKRIVIGHDDAPWLKLTARDSVRPRSREAALALATRVFTAARQAPAEFDRLVLEHSEHRDAVRNGDFGTWSSRELTPFPREVELLTKLKVGEVAAPMDSLFGYQVIQRTPNRRREQYALAKIQVRFDASRPEGTEGSEAAARDLATQLLSSLQRGASQYAKLQEQYCCAEPLRVIEGRDAPALESLLAGLKPGQMADRVLRNSTFEYVIAKRLDPSVLGPMPTSRFDFPPLGAEEASAERKQTPKGQVKGGPDRDGSDLE